MVSAVNVKANKISYPGIETINQSGSGFFGIFESFGARCTYSSTQILNPGLLRNRSLAMKEVFPI